jgi:hypothetical protein
MNNNKREGIEMLLMDIIIGHTKRDGKSGPPEFFFMHPFEVSRGPNKGKYELLRDTANAGEQQRNRSTHVTKTELAELYARGWMEGLGISLRLRPSENNYPTAPPVKKVSKNCIVPGSEFHHMVQRVDVSHPMSSDLCGALQMIGFGTAP